MKTEISAGGVIYKKDRDKTLWLVIQHSGYHKWVFPKGRQEKDETLEQTALREVQEEAGIVTKIIAKIPDTESYIYTFNGDDISKTVYYFLMEYVSGEITDHDWETEDARWVTVEEVQKLLGFPAAKKTMTAAQQLLAFHE